MCDSVFGSLIRAKLETIVSKYAYILVLIQHMHIQLDVLITPDSYKPPGIL